MTSSQTSPHNELGFLIARLARVWRRKADQVLSDHGLSDATAIPLLILSREDIGVRQGVLAEVMRIEGPSLVRLIDLLASEGLVERREDPTDRRAKLLHLTALGKSRVEHVNYLLKQLREELLQDATRAELATAFDVLSRIESRAIQSLQTADIQKQIAS